MTTVKTASKRKAPPIRVLCINGGGVRGIIPAWLLQSFEEQTNQPIHALFDVIVGTSTGGIIALAITMPNPAYPQQAMYKAQDLVQFYIEEAPRIFQASLWRQLSTGFGLWGPRYDRTNLDNILAEYFKDSRLSQALCHVGVLSFSIEKRLPRLWTSYTAQKNRYKNHYSRDAAAATSAAPTYFAPKTVLALDKNTKEEHLTEVDGGIYANNPALSALLAVAELYPDFSRKDLLVVSLGTGESNEPGHSYKGLGGIRRLISDMMRASEDMVDDMLAAIIPRYYHFQLGLSKELIPLDNGDSRHLNKLLRHTEQLLKARKKDMHTLLKQLVK